MAEIKVENLHKEFGVGEDRVVALENVNLDIKGHVFVSIVGPSGCGKSTLLNILSGIETPSTGKVTITQDNRDAEPGYVFQAAQVRGQPPAQPIERKATENLNDVHVQNFIECVMSRKQPNSDVVSAHRSALASHLGKIAYLEKKRVTYNIESERNHTLGG